MKLEFEEHEERVLEEWTALKDKLDKLTSFINAPAMSRSASIFEHLDPAEQERLRTQAVAMKTYADILEARIDAFPLPPEMTAKQVAGITGED